MNSIIIDASKCTREGLCAMVCPLGIIEPPASGKPPETGPAFSKWCIQCGHCVAVCPTGAIAHPSMRQDMCPEADYKSFPPPDKLESMLRLRRSVRRFDNRLPGKTSLERAIRLAGYAPSSHNSQPVRWMVFARREALHRLSAMAVEGMKHDMERRPAASHAPVFKKIVAAWDAGRDLLLHDAPCLVVVHSKIRTGAESTDAAIALAQFNLAAMSFGLGCCWAGLFVEATNVWRPLGDALKLPKNHQLHGAMVVGYPAVEFKRLPERRTPTIMWQ